MADTPPPTWRALAQARGIATKGERWQRTEVSLLALQTLFQPLQQRLSLLDEPACLADVPGLHSREGR